MTDMFGSEVGICAPSQQIEEMRLTYVWIWTDLPLEYREQRERARCPIPYAILIPRCTAHGIETDVYLNMEPWL
jgi:hypothetical protein